MKVPVMTPTGLGLSFSFPDMGSCLVPADEHAQCAVQQAQDKWQAYSAPQDIQFI